MLGMPTIQNRYQIPDKPAVQEFIERHPGLYEFLLTADDRLAELFGSDLHIELKVVNDPESAELHQSLFAYIFTKLPVEIAAAKLDEFDETWFLDAARQTKVNLNFNPRFL